MRPPPTAHSELEAGQRAESESYAAEERQLAGGTQRDQARAELARAQELWALHYARGLLDALQRTAQLREALRDQQQVLDASRRARQRAEREQRQLEDPAHLRGHREEAQRSEQAAGQRLETAVRKESAARQQLQTHDAELPAAENLAAGARGDLTAAREEAQQAREATIAAEAGLRGAQKRAAGARGDLERAAQGRYGAAGQSVSVLATAGIDATGLLDGLDLQGAERDAWEPRLALYRDAVCVAACDLPAARHQLAHLPGAVLIGVPGADSGRDTAVQAFLDALATRMRLLPAPVTAVDETLGLYVVGGFAHPLTGRAALLAPLRSALAQAEQEHLLAHRRCQQAKEAQATGEELVQHLVAAARAEALRAQRPALEEHLARLERQTSDLHRAHQAARAAAERALIAHETLTLQHQQAQAVVDKEQLAEERADTDRAALEQQIGELDISYWEEHGGSREAARRALGWDDAGQKGARGERRNESTLRQRAGSHLERALICVGVDIETGEEAPTAPLQQAVRLRNNAADEAGSRRFADATAFEAPARALQQWLDLFADGDASVAERVAAERAHRAARLAYGERKVAELQASLEIMQGSIALRIDQALADVEEALVELNRAAGRYGAELRRSLTPPPTLQDVWRCEVTPCWRRTPHGEMLPYDNITNWAQEKLFSIHLVLAALLASPHPQGRLLILDELGDSLGKRHRRDALQALAMSAQAEGITVLGTCQESLLDDAAEHCGELLYFTYPSHTEALNMPTRMFGYDAEGAGWS